MPANFTSPATYTVAETMTAAKMNLIRDNIEYLHTPNGSQVDLTANYTTTSATFVDFSPSISITLTTTGAPLYIGFDANFDISVGTAGNTPIHVQLVIDGVAVGDASNGIAKIMLDDFDHENRISFVRRRTGVSAGAHTVKLQWRSNGGNTVRLVGANIDGQFWVSE